MTEGGNFRVTCLLFPAEDCTLEKTERIFATRKRWKTREEAQAYADTVAESRKPLVAYCTLETSYEYGHWVVYDPDGDETEVITMKGDRFTEIEAVWDFCESFDRCTVYWNGVPCGGIYDDYSSGEGYPRCNRCSML